MKEEIKIFTPIGMVGYSYDEKVFWETIEEGVDAIIADAGSTDNGPANLALGKPLSTRSLYEKDLGLMVAACHKYRIPVLIGSAAGDGSNASVDFFLDIISKIVKENGYRPMKVIDIKAEVDKNLIKSKLKEGLVVPCGQAVSELEEKEIDASTKIVAQMGLEPYLKAMQENPDFDIIIGGRSYDPAPYAAFCVYNGITDLGVAYHMGKIMECGALCALPKSRQCVATVRKDSFDLTPRDPGAICTVTSVAAHTLYEKTRPDILLGPGGALHLTDATYEELPDHRSVRVRGAKFVPVPENGYTLKLEGAKIIGYHGMCYGGFRDSILISQIEDFLEKGKQMVKAHSPFPHELEFHIFGKDACMGPLEPDPNFVPKEICVSAHALAPTQDQAMHVVHLTRVHLMHGSYKDQKATAGNFSMPAAPLDIPLGPATAFSIYHLMTVEDPTESFPIHVETMSGGNTAPTATYEYFNHVKTELNGHANGVNGHSNTANSRPKGINGTQATHDATGLQAATSNKSILKKDPPVGHVFLADLCRVLRSKNSGPYELTFDIMFPDAETREFVKRTNVLNVNTVAKLYQITPKDVITCMWWDPANAFKATIKRPRVSGGFGEHDMHGATQHMPFMELAVPVV